MSRYVVVGLVPEPYRQQLAEIRKRLDTFSRQWLPPHITIIRPFDLFLSREEIQTLRDLRVNLAATFNGWGSFKREHSSVLFLELRDHTIDSVRNELLQTIPRLSQFADQDPHDHVTVVSRIPNEQFESIQTEIAKERIEGTFFVDRFMLYRWDDFVRRWIAITIGGE